MGSETMSKLQLWTIMWRTLRVRKTLTVDDLIELSGASRYYAKNFLRRLIKREIVRAIKIGRKWKYQLINDPVIMPEILRSEKASKIRAEKKKVSAAINRIIEISSED